MKTANEIAEGIIAQDFDVSKQDIDILTKGAQKLNSDRPNICQISGNKFIFIGDLHGELASLLAVKRLMRKYREYSFVFLGDYADRGPRQIDTFNLVLSLHLLNPERVVILRGNHESEEIAARYGFEMAVQREFDRKTFSYYLRVFEAIPLGAISDNNIFACHGGIPEGVESLQDLQEPDRHHVNFPSDTLFQLAWNDPKSADFDFRPNMRSRRARTYGQRAFQKFSENLEIDLMVRAHEVYRMGYQEYFNGKLISIFSASYKGRSSPKAVRVGAKHQIEIISLDV